MSNSGDIYKRRKIGRDIMQCGCCWVENEHGSGQRLEECLIHRQATAARVRRFERQRGITCQAVRQ
jgi:hypothetical protein